MMMNNINNNKQLNIHFLPRLICIDNNNNHSTNEYYMLHTGLVGGVLSKSMDGLVDNW